MPLVVESKDFLSKQVCTRVAPGDAVDDATNQMLRELIDGDAVQQFDELGILDPEKKVAMS